jgi:hypothetical protein
MESTQPWEMTYDDYKKELHMPFDGIRNSKEGGVEYVATPETLTADEVLDHLRQGGKMSAVDDMIADINADESQSKAHRRAIVAAIGRAKEHYQSTAKAGRNELAKLDGQFKVSLNKEFPVSNRGDKHKAAVNEAIVAGKILSPEVLKQYPDLAAKYASREQ